MTRIACLTIVLMAITILPCPAQPPLRPMILHGEVVVDGDAVPQDTEITLTVDGVGEIKGETLLSHGASRSCYTIQIPADRSETTEIEGAKPNARVAISSMKLSSGERSLSAIPPIGWQEGGVTRQDIQINPSTAGLPEIIAVSAVKTENGGFDLKCEFTRSGMPVAWSYKVGWYLVKQDEKKELTTVALAEKTITSEEIRLTDGNTHAVQLAVSKADEGLYLELVIQPVSETGKIAPSQYRKLFYTVSGGQL